MVIYSGVYFTTTNLMGKIKNDTKDLINRIEPNPIEEYNVPSKQIHSRNTHKNAQQKGRKCCAREFIYLFTCCINKFLYVGTQSNKIPSENHVVVGLR